jgi:hypothetical protein
MADRPPAALVQIGETAASLFDAAYASDWSTANELVQALNQSASALPTALPKPDLVGQLHSLLQYVTQHVSDQQRVRTMDDANGLTRVVADLSAEFQTQVPYEAVMLGYYGRQLELGIAAQKPSTLTQAATDLQSTWNRIEPAVERRGDVDDARRFSDTVAQLIGARRPADFVSPTRAALTEAGRIEKLFHSPA